MESFKAAVSACRHYDSGSYIRRAGGSSWRASKKQVLPVITTTAGSIMRYRAAERRAGGSAWGTSRQRMLLSSLRQRVVRRGIAPPSGQRMMSGEAVGNTCHCYDTRRRAGGVAWIAFRQWLPPVITTTAVSCICRRAGGIAGRASTVDTSRHRAAAGRAAKHGEHQCRGYCMSSLRQWVVY